jgi:hypothetical protein
MSWSISRLGDSAVSADASCVQLSKHRGEPIERLRDSRIGLDRAEVGIAEWGLSGDGVDSHSLVCSFGSFAATACRLISPPYQWVIRYSTG